MGSFSHLIFPTDKTEERWYTPLRAVTNEKTCFVKEFYNNEMKFNQDGRPDELYFGFEDILKHDSIWNDKLFSKDIKEWSKIYNANKMSYYEKENLPSLVEIIMDKIIWEHISPYLRVKCDIGPSPILNNESVNIIIIVTPSYPDNFVKVEKWIKSLHIPFNLKRSMPNHLIRRRALDIFMILKNEMIAIGLIAKMPSINQESIVIKQIMKAIIDFSSLYDYAGCYSSCSSLDKSKSDSDVSFHDFSYSYFVTLEICRKEVNENEEENMYYYYYHFSDMKLCTQNITNAYEIEIS